MPSNFSGFSAESFQFFRELRENNHKAWFDQNRSRYENSVTGAFRSLLDALEPAALKLNPHFEVGGKTNGNFSRINRDIRFSKDKSPYKSNYYLYFYDSRRSRDTDGRLYVGLSADCVTVGFAIYASWKKGVAGTLETVFRPRFEKGRAQFLRLAAAVKRKRYESYWYRMEKKEWVLHPGLPKKDDFFGDGQAKLDSAIRRSVFSDALFNRFLASSGRDRKGGPVWLTHGQRNHWMPFGLKLFGFCDQK